jgi:tRNA (guanine37-N1)-methyltransferase
MLNDAQGVGMRITVITLFPALVRDALDHGVVGRALTQGRLRVECIDPREFATDVHRTVDDRPYGGGPGMVLKVEPLRSAIERAQTQMPAGSRRVYMGADGERFEQARAREALGWPGLILVAGRYEGVDQRLLDAHIDTTWSIMCCRAVSYPRWW